MELPFDGLPGAKYIRDLSDDIVPVVIRDYQHKLNVPCLDPLGCRFLSLISSIKKPKNAIDIGCGIGASTISIHIGCKSAYIDAIDANLDRYNAAKLLLNDIDNIDVYHNLALNFLNDNDVKYDLAFVDTIKKGW